MTGVSSILVAMFEGHGNGRPRWIDRFVRGNYMDAHDFDSAVTAFRDALGSLAESSTKAGRRDRIAPTWVPPVRSAS